MGEKLVELRNITKSFGNVCALNQVNMHVNAGEIIGLVGDNGAGKSTLIKILSGVYAPDSGEIYIRGQQVERWSVPKAQAAGIETVYQDRALAVQQTIAQNIFMGREITRFMDFISLKEQFVEAERLMREIGFTSEVFTPNSIVATLSGGERQGVAIARALYFDADLIILDEPTAALSLTESHKVFDFMRAAQAKGSSAIFISHNIYHAYDVSDRFVILDRGRVIMEADKAQISSAEQLVEDLRMIARTGQRLS